MIRGRVVAKVLMGLHLLVTIMERLAVTVARAMMEVEEEVVVTAPLDMSQKGSLRSNSFMRGGRVAKGASRE